MGEIRAYGVAVDVPPPNGIACQQRLRRIDEASARYSCDRNSLIWPLFVVGLGLLATVVWTALLGWVVYRAVLMLLLA
jgi:hypothetical protein